MAQKMKRLFSGGMAAALLGTALWGNALPVYAAEDAEKKQYVVMAETDAVYEEITEEAGDSIVMDSPVLAENNVAVAEMTEKEAAALGKEDGVLVEEDIVLEGSAAEEGMRDVERAREEMRRKKETFYARMQENEGSGGTEEEPEWNLQAVNADIPAEGEDAPAQKVKVAVLDSGVDYVSGINLKGYVNFVYEDQDMSEIFQDLSGHGTGIAGIIAGNGESGVYGVNPNAELYSVRVLDEENRAKLSVIIRGIYWCIEHDMNIIDTARHLKDY